MCAPSPPPAPDLNAAARAQGAANVDTARVQGRINNPNIITPYGSQTVQFGSPTFDQAGFDKAMADWNRATGDGRFPMAASAPVRSDFMRGGDQPTVTQTLSPELQGIFDRTLNTNVDFNRDIGTRQEGKQEVIDSLMRRYDTDLGRRREDIESTLISRGIPRGSEAWNREMEMLDRGRNDAFQQATLNADNRSLDDRRQAITELLAQRQTPLQEVNALRSGSQIAPVQFQGANVGQTPVFNAATGQYGANADLYNANAANAASMRSGLFALGAAAISDRRLKRDIARVGTHALGFGIYQFRYLWDDTLRVGAMADEVELVLPEAVIDVGNYKAVNYALL